MTASTSLTSSSINHIWSQRVSVKLTKPYTIASETIAAVDLCYLRLRTQSGHIGLGCASPSARVTGETDQACEQALAAHSLHWLIGQDCRDLAALCQQAKQHLATTPAALAAVDMALHDLACQQAGIPLVDHLGRCHASLPTSVTIGIKPLGEALAEAAAVVREGFRCLKIKLGHNVHEDIERLHKLREQLGTTVALRVDPNQGYTIHDLTTFLAETATLGIELVEQPLPTSQDDALRALSADHRATIAADESVHNAADAERLSHPPAACGIFNIKLMKCGGITGAQDIAQVAQATNTQLMWGCNDESVISIAAALHTAYANAHTRYLDLDGSFDLATDLAHGGFAIKDGQLHLLSDRAGLGVTLDAV